MQACGSPRPRVADVREVRRRPRGDLPDARGAGSGETGRPWTPRSSSRRRLQRRSRRSSAGDFSNCAVRVSSLRYNGFRHQHPRDEPLAATSLDGVRLHGSRCGMDREAAAGLGWADGPRRRGRDPTPRARLRPQGQPLVTAPPGALLGRVDPTAVWTGHSMLVWGGAAGDGRSFAGGAVFRPTTP